LGAFAQVPPDPNEAVPDAMVQPEYGEPINLETAKKVAAGAPAEATKRNWRGLCIAVVGPSGDLVYFERSDNCQLASISISQHKARAAAHYRRPTVVFERLIGKGPYFSYLAPESRLSDCSGRRRVGATIGLRHLTGCFTKDMFEGIFEGFGCAWKVVLKIKRPQ
jgi:Haem degrading protein HbpS-like